MFTMKDVSIRANELARVLLDDYTDRVKVGGEASDEALHNAVNWTLREYVDEVQAMAYAQLAERWSNDTTRLIAAENVISGVLLGSKSRSGYLRG